MCRSICDEQSEVGAEGVHPPVIPYRAAVASALLLAVACYLPTAPAAKQAELAVFLFAGQSNMGGADSIVPDPPGFQQTEADRATLFTTAPLPQAHKAREYLPWSDIHGYRGPGGKVVQGPEVGFARQLHDAGWRNVAIIKVYGNFSGDADRWPWGRGGPLYEGWTRFVDARLAELQARGYRYRVRGFVWHQGIDDALQGKLAARYQENLTRLIGVLRRRYADENTPFVLARSVNSTIAQARTGSGENDPMAVVRRAQVAVGSSVSQAGWIDVDDLPNVNRHHFTADGQLAIGTRFGERFLKLAKRRY
jgi:hypothetical protein